MHHAAVEIAGASTCSLSTSSLFGAWPVGSTPSPALDLEAITATTHRVWLHDCAIVGGFDALGGVGPAIIAPQPPAPVPVRCYDCQIFGAVNGGVAFGPLIGLRTSVDVQLGATFTTTVFGEPGHIMLFYAGTDVIGSIPIPFAEQPALGFIGFTTVGVEVANAQGEADFPFFVPNHPVLRHSVLWWRVLDMSVSPWQVTPSFPTLIQ